MYAFLYLLPDNYIEPWKGLIFAWLFENATRELEKKTRWEHIQGGPRQYRRTMSLISLKYYCIMYIHNLHARIVVKYPTCRWGTPYAKHAQDTKRAFSSCLLDMQQTKKHEQRTKVATSSPLSVKTWVQVTTQLELPFARPKPLETQSSRT